MHVVRECVIIVLFLDLAFPALRTPSRGIFRKGYTRAPNNWRKELFRGFPEIFLRRR